MNQIPYILPKYEITIDDSLGYSISAFGWLLPDVHELYLENKRSVRNVKPCQTIQHFTQHFTEHLVWCWMMFNHGVVKRSNISLNNMFSEMLGRMLDRLTRALHIIFAMLYSPCYIRP